MKEKELNREERNKTVMETGALVIITLVKKSSPINNHFSITLTASR